MKMKLRLSVAAAAALLGGCVVTSIYPFYTEKDLVYDPALLGKWSDAAETNASAEYVSIERSGDKGYRITVFASETNTIEAHLFRLRQQLFLDTFPTNRSLDFVPVHQLSKILSTAPELKNANLNYDWLAKLLEKNPGEIRHMVLAEKSGEQTDKRIVLTADTAELQQFLLKYHDNTNTWNEPASWKHRLEAKAESGK
jgi:hypothetical protein